MKNHGFPWPFFHVIKVRSTNIFSLTKNLNTVLHSPILFSSPPLPPAPFQIDRWQNDKGRKITVSHFQDLLAHFFLKNRNSLFFKILEYTTRKLLIFTNNEGLKKNLTWWKIHSIKSKMNKVKNQLKNYFKKL